MFSMSLVSPLKADSQTELAIPIEDPEAFFLFLAHSIEEQGELLTPLDIEELQPDETNVDHANSLKTTQEETRP